MRTVSLSTVGRRWQENRWGMECGLHMCDEVVLMWMSVGSGYGNDVLEEDAHRPCLPEAWWLRF